MNINIPNRTDYDNTNVDLCGCWKSDIKWLSPIFNLQIELHLLREGESSNACVDEKFCIWKRFLLMIQNIQFLGAVNKFSILHTNP